MNEIQDPRYQRLALRSLSPVSSPTKIRNSINKQTRKKKCTHLHTAHILHTCCTLCTHVCCTPFTRLHTHTAHPTTPASPTPTTPMPLPVPLLLLQGQDRLKGSKQGQQSRNILLYKRRRSRTNAPLRGNRRSCRLTPAPARYMNARRTRRSPTARRTRSRIFTIPAAGARAPTVNNAAG